MRVLWLVRRNLSQHPGGDTTQIMHTAAALRALGIKIELSHDSRCDLAGYDLVHLFHLDRLWENLEHCRRARSAGRPIALSTIYWPPEEFHLAGRPGVAGLLVRCLGGPAYQNLRLVVRHILNACERGRLPRLDPRDLSFRRCVRELLDTASVLLPNSRTEQQAIEARFGVARPAVVVPNAADSAIFGPPAGESPTRAGVLCVGRIEPRKNQLALIQSLSGRGIPLTLVGQPGRYSRGYYRRCRRAADANVRFVGHQPPAKLCQLYRAARVHACVSWYETPGLASLEAALCGCAVVVSPGGCTREYFGDQAVYAQPGDPDSIRAAVEQALQCGPAPGLADRVAHEYTWEAAAQKTAEAYRLALRGGR
jgi:glycosyltransferase involved in cell wall biosynthesis